MYTLECSAWSDNLTECFGMRRLRVYCAIVRKKKLTRYHCCSDRLRRWTPSLSPPSPPPLIHRLGPPIFLPWCLEPTLAISSGKLAKDPYQKTPPPAVRYPVPKIELIRVYTPPLSRIVAASWLRERSSSVGETLSLRGLRDGSESHSSLWLSFMAWQW